MIYLCKNSFCEWKRNDEASFLKLQGYPEISCFMLPKANVTLVIIDVWKLPLLMYVLHVFSGGKKGHQSVTLISKLSFISLILTLTYWTPISYKALYPMLAVIPNAETDSGITPGPSSAHECSLSPITGMFSNVSQI